MPIFLDVMKEELERNLYKQDTFINQYKSLFQDKKSNLRVDSTSTILP